MSEVSSMPGIPEEILSFLRSPGAHSLIVKGPAGTGKTTFALQLAEELGGINRSFYMSTRVSDASLFHQFPWLRDRLKEASIEVAGRQFTRTLVEHEVHREGETDVSLEIRVRGDTRPLEGSKHRVDRTELEKLEGRIEMGEEGDETYERHGEGQISEGSLIVDLGADLPEIDMAYDAVERNLPEKTLILIDSINALNERYGIHASKLINTLQKDLVEKGKANVVYTLEEGGQTKLDYLGDGVITFESREHTGRRLRVFTIDKLRGTEVQQHKFIYTLEGARLRAFRIEPGIRFGGRGEWRAVPDISKDVVSTGNEAIDSLIGGLHRSRVTSFEFDVNVPAEYIDAFRLGLVCNFAAMGRGIAHVPPRKGSMDYLKEIAAGHLPAGAFDQHVRVFETTSLGGLEAPKGALHMEGSNVDSDLKWSNVEYHLPKSSRPFLSILSFDTLESVYGADVLEELSGHMAAVRRQGDIFIGLTTPLTSSNQKLASMANQHIKIENLDGSIVLYGEKPHTVLYNLAFAVESGCPKAVLTPIV